MCLCPQRGCASKSLSEHFIRVREGVGLLSDFAACSEHQEHHRNRQILDHRFHLLGWDYDEVWPINMSLGLESRTCPELIF
jgi:hypothetical protein